MGAPVDTMLHPLFRQAWRYTEDIKANTALLLLHSFITVGTGVLAFVTAPLGYPLVPPAAGTQSVPLQRLNPRSPHWWKSSSVKNLSVFFFLLSLLTLFLTLFTLWRDLPECLVNEIRGSGGDSRGGGAPFPPLWLVPGWLAVTLRHACQKYTMHPTLVKWKYLTMSITLSNYVYNFLTVSITMSITISNTVHNFLTMSITLSAAICLYEMQNNIV